MRKVIMILVCAQILLSMAGCQSAQETATTSTTATSTTSSSSTTIITTTTAVATSTSTSTTTASTTTTLPPSGGGDIWGTVKEIVTLTPIANALVTIEGSVLQAITNSSGEYVLSNVEAGPQSIIAVASNYEANKEYPVTVTKNSTTEVNFLLISYYPLTANSPMLVFTWEATSTFGPLNLTSESSGHIYGCGPFGVTEEGGDLNQEMAIFFKHRQREPIYAPCAGVVSYFYPWVTYETASLAGNGGEIWLRHGTNYAVGFRHTVTQGLSLSQGQKVATGEVIGYVADNNIGLGTYEAFFEFVVAGKENGHYYFYKAYPDYFDNPSRTLLLNIWNSAQIKTGLGDYGYDNVSQPWGDLPKFESVGGNQEIPFKGRL